MLGQCLNSKEEKHSLLTVIDTDSKSFFQTSIIKSSISTKFLSSNEKVQSPFNSFISKSWITVPEINPMDDVEENRLRKLIETIAEFMKISYYGISSEVVK